MRTIIISNSLSVSFILRALFNGNIQAVHEICAIHFDLSNETEKKARMSALALIGPFVRSILFTYTTVITKHLLTFRISFVHMK